MFKSNAFSSYILLTIDYFICAIRMHNIIDISMKLHYKLLQISEDLRVNVIFYNI